MEAAGRKELAVIPFIHGGSAVPALDTLSPHDNNLFFVNELRRRVQNVMASRPTVAEAALCVLSVLQQVVLREASDVRFEEGLEKLLDSLSAEPLAKRSFGFIYRQSKEVLQSLLSRFEVSEDLAVRILKDLSSLLEWYGARSQSLVRIGSDDALLHMGSEGVFSLDVQHDVERHGIPGFEVEAGILLDSRSEETVWIKVYPLFRGQPLFAASGWESWTDESGKGEASVGDYVCVSVPLSCTGSRTVGRIIVDSAKVFIPYASMEWPSDVHAKTAECTIVVSVCDQSEEKIFSKSSLETLRIWSKRGMGLTLPSPQSSELWSRCPIRNHAIRNVVLIGNAAEEDHGLEVVCDVSVTGYLTRDVTLELRILDEQQNMVECLSDEMSDERGYYFRASVLSPSHIFADFEDVGFGILFRDLRLQEGISNLFIELTLLDDNRKVLCGVIEPISVRVR